MKSGIYALFCDHWTYIGSSIDVDKRIKQHFYCPSNQRIKIHKLNGCVIKKKVILRCEIEELNRLEAYCIAKISPERLANVQKTVASKRRHNMSRKVKLVRPKFIPLLAPRKK